MENVGPVRNEIHGSTIASNQRRLGIGRNNPLTAGHVPRATSHWRILANFHRVQKPKQGLVFQWKEGWAQSVADSHNR
jgi:hypothetical protein